MLKWRIDLRIGGNGNTRYESGPFAIRINRGTGQWVLTRSFAFVGRYPDLAQAKQAAVRYAERVDPTLGGAK